MNNKIIQTQQEIVSQVNLGSIQKINTNGEWFESLITDLQRLWIEENVNLIESRWNIGDRLEKDKDKGITKILKRISVNSGIGERTLWFCLQFRRTYPYLPEEIKKLPWRENIKKLQEPKKKNFEYKVFNIWSFGGCQRFNYISKICLKNNS